VPSGGARGSRHAAGQRRTLLRALIRLPATIAAVAAWAILFPGTPPELSPLVGFALLAHGAVLAAATAPLLFRRPLPRLAGALGLFGLYAAATVAVTWWICAPFHSAQC